MLNCQYCKHRRGVSWHAHISCANPDKDMTGDPYGIKRGWFLYPTIFDPIWATKPCANFERKLANDISEPDTFTPAMLNAMVDSFMRDTPEVKQESSDSPSENNSSGGGGEFGGGGASSDY